MRWEERRERCAIRPKAALLRRRENLSLAMVVLRWLGMLALIAIVSTALYALDPYHAGETIRAQGARLAAWWSSSARGWLSGTAQPGAQTAADRAERALTKNDSQLALEYVRQSLAGPGTDAPTAYRLGNVAQRAGDDSLAVVAYARGEAADAQYPWNYIALGQLSARLNRLIPADAQLRQAIQLQPSMQFLHYDLAMVELAEHRPGDALRDFNAELGLSHGFTPAVSGRALAQAQLSHQSVAVAGAPSALALPAPSPSPSPSSSPTPSTSPSASASPTPTRTPARLARSARAKGVVIPARLRVATVAQAAPAQTEPPAPAPTGTPSPTPTPVPTAMPASVTADARSYLLAVSRDLGFTRAIPGGDPTMLTSDLQARLRSALAERTFSIEDLLHVGASALLSGRLAIAERAFDAATGRARTDWRGPYLQALVSRAGGDDVRARTLLNEAASRAQRPEIYTSLAIIDLESGDQASARQNAERAVDIDPNYTPGRFTAGMLALIGSDKEAAARNLAAATNLSGAPARSSYFFGLVSAH